MYKIDDTEASLIIDDFSQSHSIQITKVAGDVQNLFVETFEFSIDIFSISNLKRLSFQFAYDDNNFFLRLKGIGYNKDVIHFLFENGMCIEKVITYNKSLHRNDYAAVIPLTNEEIKLFATVFLKKWKLTNTSSNTYVIGGFIDNKYFEQYPTSEEGQYLLLLTARQLIKQVLFHYPKEVLIEL